MLSVFCLLGMLTAGFHADAATLKDSDGRTISFNHPFTRIVSLYPAHTRNLLDLGLNKEIIATDRNDRQLPGRPHVSFRDDPERILALKPDLILIRPMISRHHPNLVHRLEQSGVTVVSLQPTSADELFPYWRALGLLTGREKQAEMMIRRFRQGLAEIRKKVSAIPLKRRKRVYFESIHRRMKTFAPGSIAIFVLESAGGINVASDALQLRNTNIASYGKEHILSKANQIDVFLAQRGRMNPVTVEDILREPGFQVIKAVRQGQVFLVDEKIVSRPTLDLLKGIRKINSILYPPRPGENIAHAR